MSLLGVEAALDAVLARTRPLDSEQVVLADACGRVLTEPARALVDLPPFDSSAMDGFAVRAADTPGRLRLVAASAAGSPASAALAEGTAAPISTGAVVPEGADAVVPIERARETSTEVVVEAAEPGAFVRPRGGDALAGSPIVEQGERLSAWSVGALAAAGLAQVVCGARPRVAILSTGSELRRPGEPLAPGQIYEANAFLLAALVAGAGAVVERTATVEDDPALTRAALEAGLASDVLITTGGVSVGRHDLVRPALADLGVDEAFWRVAVKPGKPVAFGVRGRTLVFGLPGNPVSALVGFELFVRPALLALQGAATPRPAWQPGRLTSSVRRDEKRDQLVRARFAGGAGSTMLEPVSGQESHMIARAGAANALVLVERGADELPAGAAVRYLASYGA